MRLLLVPGAWHGAWCWAPITAPLAAAGFDVHTVDLPSVAEGGVRRGLHDDARAVRAAIDAIGGPVVVVGHSYGGAVISEAAAGAPNVRRLVYLAAWQLDRGESVLGRRGGTPPDAWRIADGAVTIPEPARFFYHDVDPDAAAAAAARLRPMSLTAFTESLDAAAWHDIPSSYVVCDDDRTIPPAVQAELAPCATETHHLPTGHSPFLARPAETAALLAAIAG